MLEDFSKVYLSNKNYTAIYLHNFFDVIGKSLMSFFSGIILYQLGVPIHYILLFFALKFGCMGALSPLSLVLTSRIGLLRTIIFSNTCYVIGSSLLILGSYENKVLLFSSLFFLAVKGATYHPLIDGVISMYVENEHRGRFNSLNAIFRIIAVFISIGIGGFFLILDQKIMVVMVIIFTLLCSVVSYALFLERREIKNKYTFREVYQYFVSSKFRENIVPFGVQSFLIIERIFISLFIFLMIGSLKSTTIIILASVFVEMSIIFVFGKQVDRFSKKSFLSASIIKSVNSLLFLASYVMPPIIYLIQTYNRIAENLFETSFSTNYQKKARKIEDPILFTTAKEMTLCFAELVFLTILCVISILIQEKVFAFIFLGSFLSTGVIYRKWKD